MASVLELRGSSGYGKEIKMENPKLKGSCIIDCIPQTGECPNGCNQCYYNGGRFYRPLDTPKIPTKEEAEGKMVRMNSGHDSNLQRELVIETSMKYEHPYYNTSIPNLEFPGPVILTVNGQNTDYAFHTIVGDINLANLMAVRVRVNTWNLHLVDEVVRYYASKDVYVLLTWMRYYDRRPEKAPGAYEYKYHIQNPSYRLTDEAWETVMERYEGCMYVHSCGRPAKLCVACGMCVWLYGHWCKKVGKACNLAG